MGFRLDRAATLYLVNPIRRHLSPRTSSVPILMYHSIGHDSEAGVHPYYRITTSPSVFSQHMEHLSREGYTTTSLAEAVHRLSIHGRINGNHPAKTAVITFDDGFADFHTNAFPILNRHGFTATVFLPTAFVGTQPIPFKGKDCLTWAEVRELRRQGIHFGSHTVTHPQLRTLNDDAIQTEIVDSRKAIEDNLGETVSTFSYPFAFPEGDVAFTKRLRDILVAAGYQQGVSTRIGLARNTDDCFFMRRLPINSLDDNALFSAKLDGGYDWLHGLQYASKLLTGRN